MTKSTITRERLEKIKSWRETFGAGSNVILPAEEAEELARMALAAMDSEPVAIVEPSDYVTAAQLVDEEPARKAVRELYEGALRIGDKLYRHAQPVAVVPYDFDFDRFNDVVWLECVASNPHMHSPTTSIIARVALELNKRILAGNSPVITDGWKMVPIDATRAMIDAARRVEEDGYDAMHKAMLAAAPQSPGSEPATVPGKWIPVSERMPEDRISVILWDAEIGEVTSGHYSHKTQTFYHCGDAIENEITHWMPPPCAPQEVK